MIRSRTNKVVKVVNFARNVVNVVAEGRSGNTVTKRVRAGRTIYVYKSEQSEREMVSLWDTTTTVLEPSRSQDAYARGGRARR